MAETIVRCPLCLKKSLHRKTSEEDRWTVEVCIGGGSFTVFDEEEQENVHFKCPYWYAYFKEAA